MNEDRPNGSIILNLTDVNSSIVSCAVIDKKDWYILSRRIYFEVEIIDLNESQLSSSQ